MCFAWSTAGRSCHTARCSTSSTRADSLPRRAVWRIVTARMATTSYFISDLHIGGDGGLSRCDFEEELIGFLQEIAAGPQPAELIIVGDAFGFWELTDRAGVSKLATIALQHPALFRQLRETGERVTITLLPGNHDYDLACVPEYKGELAK